MSDSGFASGGSTDPNGTSHLEGPVPLPTESPFLSDHGVTEEDMAARAPAATPSGLSQFPSTSVPPGVSPAAYAAAGKTQAVPRSAVNPGSSSGPAPRVDGESLSSFPLFTAENTAENSFANQGSGSIPRPTSSSDLVERLRSILVTTTDSLQGRLVQEYLGVVSSEALVPLDTVLEGAERTGRFSRYKTSQQKLKALEQLVIAELKLEAEKVGGNAVVGTQVRVSLDHSVVLLIATGTAVLVQ
ncbi:MAG: heavy metal-binding domain-containing protein [Fibrobacterota bacterium]|nr:heavy metal-binding domain-containing protein [Fibrobacterota bacterium]QQS03177.1 MAG: heavy metal-binding domain-containing protein [Fibrobacterota bacterium]